MPTFPSFLTVNREVLAEFSTSSAVVALVVPVPRTSNLAVGVMEPIPTLVPLSNNNEFVRVPALANFDK
jgi:hypothetical protein